MNNELFELCKEVYKQFPLWAGTTHCWMTGSDGTAAILTQEAPLYTERGIKWECPLYTSDYLLEKLLPVTSIRFIPQANGQIYLQWWPTEPNYDDIFASTPLKALLKLTLTLNKIAGKQY